MAHRGFLLLMLCGCGPGTAMATLDWGASVTPTPAPDQRLPRLGVVGRELRSGYVPIVLRGVNVCSLESDFNGTNWEVSFDHSAVLQTLADPERWHANVVRIPLNQQWMIEEEGYRQRVEHLIDDANARGIYVVLDDQWELGQTLDPYDKNILELPTFGDGNTTEAFWFTVTSRWANRTNLMFDLINEPHGHDDAETAHALQVLADAIRQRDEQTPILIGGSNWAHSVQYYVDHPLRGTNLVYSAHQYLPSDTPSTFDAHFARPAATIPVLVGEFLADPNDATYATQVVDAAESSGAVGWLPWAIGCGFTKDSDQTDEPFKTLAAKMRDLNR